MKRKTFIQRGSLLAGGILVSPALLDKKKNSTTIKIDTQSTPYAISTWDVPMANKIAGAALDRGINALEAAVSGADDDEHHAADCDLATHSHAMPLANHTQTQNSKLKTQNRKISKKQRFRILKK